MHLRFKGTVREFQATLRAKMGMSDFTTLLSFDSQPFSNQQCGNYIVMFSSNIFYLLYSSKYLCAYCRETIFDKKLIIFKNLLYLKVIKLLIK